MTLPYDTILLHETIVHTKLHSYRMLDDYYNHILIRNYTDTRIAFKNAWIRDCFGSRNEFFCQRTIYEIRVRKNKIIHNITRVIKKRPFMCSILYVD